MQSRRTGHDGPRVAPAVALCPGEALTAACLEVGKIFILKVASQPHPENMYLSWGVIDGQRIRQLYVDPKILSLVGRNSV